jgi:hypothetical protein
MTACLFAALEMACVNVDEVFAGALPPRCGRLRPHAP